MEYYDHADLIDLACVSLLEHAEDSHLAQLLMLGFDIEYETETTGQGGPGMVLHAQIGHIDMIQVACEDIIYVFKVC